MHSPESILENESQNNSLGFWDTNGPPNLDLVLVKKRKKKNEPAE